MIEASRCEKSFKITHRERPNYSWNRTIRICVNYGNLIPSTIDVRFVVRERSFGVIPIVDYAWVLHIGARRGLKIYVTTSEENLKKVLKD